MKKPDIPPNEQERLRTLQSLDILDTLSDENFDRVTRMAKRLFKVPIALVSLVDRNRQWFKSCDGLNVRETPRDISFCGHAILGDEVFVIPDTLNDERFRDNPLVIHEPNIRFYAGCPIQLSNGCRVGTLCIIDQVPHEFSFEDEALLRDLTSSIQRELTVLEVASRDELTSLSNRRGFNCISEKVLALRQRQETGTTLAFFDLNDFKGINDNYGHVVGDQALVIFSHALRRTFRESDVIARIGGDEFVVLIPGVSTNQSQLLIARLLKTVKSLRTKMNLKCDISFSSGFVDFHPDKHRTIYDLLACADASMYENKGIVSKKFVGGQSGSHRITGGHVL